MSTSFAPLAAQANGILRHLSSAEYSVITDDLELVELRVQQVLYNGGSDIHDVYFPVTSVLSLMHVMEDGAMTEVASVGPEGMLGIAAATNGLSMVHNAHVCLAGNAYRMRVNRFRSHFNELKGLRNAVMTYFDFFFKLSTMLAGCARRHAIDEQVCRWLLVNFDRNDGRPQYITHQAIADALGVRREGVTDVMGYLDRHGIVQRSRGRIEMLDRPRLEARSCACYAWLRPDFARLKRAQHY